MTIAQEVLARRIRVARGLEPADLILAGGRVLNVFTGTCEPADVAIVDGVVAAVGQLAFPPARTTERIDFLTVLPGLIDAHMHLESTLLCPGEYARLTAPHGTAAVVADPHEIGNVSGARGLRAMARAALGLPVDFLWNVPSCVPALEWDQSGAALDAAAVADLLADPAFFGLAEVMDFPSVLAGGADKLAKIVAALRLGKPLDGHAPRLMGHDLQAYAAAGIRSDHESTTIPEAVAKAEAGMLVQVREGSVARNLNDLMPAILAGRLGEWCLCTDDIYPDDLARHGHIDHLVARLVAHGLPAATAVRHATLVPARHYGLSDRGAVAPGRRADIHVVSDLRTFQPRLTLHGGRVTGRDGTFVGDWPNGMMAADDSVQPAALALSALRVKLSSNRVPVIRVYPGQIVTTAENRTVQRDAAGCWVFDPESDILAAAAVERHTGTGDIGLGLVTGFGLRRGAIAGSVAHDSHNLLAVGADAADMHAALAAVTAMGGGFAAVLEGRVLAQLPLPVAGLLSDAGRAEVLAGLGAVNRAAEGLGCPLPAPFGTLSFIALPVIPELRITTRGLFDVRTMTFVKL